MNEKHLRHRRVGDSARWWDHYICLVMLLLYIVGATDSRIERVATPHQLIALATWHDDDITLACHATTVVGATVGRADQLIAYRT